MNKRHILIFSVVFIFSLSSQAQGLVDALKYGDNDIIGTARYMSLAGSMGAVGGDPSAILDNPAALGIYRGAELSFTLNATPNRTYAASDIGRITSNNFFFNFNQLSYLFSIQHRESGYISSNFAISYNRLRDFHRNIKVERHNASSIANLMAGLSEGFAPNDIKQENEYVPYLSVLGYEGFLIDPTGDSLSYLPYDTRSARSVFGGKERGSINEYTFSYAANIGHFLYIGANIGIQTLDYVLDADYGEVFAPTAYAPSGARMELNNSFSAHGTGVNFRFGAIARPVDFIRIGFSIHTPTYYTMRESFFGSIAADNTQADGVRTLYQTPSGGSIYLYNSPLRMQASVGFVLGKSGLVNFDYLYSDYSSMKFSSGTESESVFTLPEFEFENSEIQKYALKQHTFKIGAEYRVASQLSFRAGFAYRLPNCSDLTTRTILDNTTRTDMHFTLDRGSLYGSCGLGYRYNGFGIDLAYAYSQRNQDFYAFQQDGQLMSGGIYSGHYGVVSPNRETMRTSGTSIRTVHHNVVLTLLFKF